MRVIGGKYRSRVLSEFAGENVRPTSDRAREALFNILSLKIYGARVLDLFAGSGAHHFHRARLAGGLGPLHFLLRRNQQNEPPQQNMQQNGECHAKKHPPKSFLLPFIHYSPVCHQCVPCTSFLPVLKLTVC